MTLSTDSDVKKFLDSIELPDVGLKLGDVGRVLGVERGADRIAVRVRLGFPAQTAHEDYAASIAGASL